MFHAVRLKTHVGLYSNPDGNLLVPKMLSFFVYSLSFYSVCAQNTVLLARILIVLQRLLIKGNASEHLVGLHSKALDLGAFNIEPTAVGFRVNNTCILVTAPKPEQPILKTQGSWFKPKPARKRQPQRGFRGRFTRRTIQPPGPRDTPRPESPQGTHLQSPWNGPGPSTDPIVNKKLSFW